MSSMTITTKGDGSTSVMLDGQEIAHLIAVGGLSIQPWGHNQLVQVDVRLAVTDLALHLPDADLVLDEATCALLVSRGWVPPTEGQDV